MRLESCRCLAKVWLEVASLGVSVLVARRVHRDVVAKDLLGPAQRVLLAILDHEHLVPQWHFAADFTPCGVGKRRLADAILIEVADLPLTRGDLDKRGPITPGDQLLEVAHGLPLALLARAACVADLELLDALAPLGADLLREHQRVLALAVLPAERVRHRKLHLDARWRLVVVGKLRDVGVIVRGRRLFRVSGWRACFVAVCLGGGLCWLL